MHMRSPKISKLSSFLLEVLDSQPTTHRVKVQLNIIKWDKLKLRWLRNLVSYTLFLLCCHFWEKLISKASLLKWHLSKVILRLFKLNAFSEYWWRLASVPFHCKLTKVLCTDITWQSSHALPVTNLYPNQRCSDKRPFTAAGGNNPNPSAPNSSNPNHS
jgi:hypothetical protein